MTLIGNLKKTNLSLIFLYRWTFCSCGVIFSKLSSSIGSSRIEDRFGAASQNVAKTTESTQKRLKILMLLCCYLKVAQNLFELENVVFFGLKLRVY